MRALPVGFWLYLLSLLAFMICVRDHRLSLLRFPLSSLFANGSGEAERPAVGGGSAAGEGGLCTIRFSARCGAASLLLPAPGYSERDVVLLVYLSTANRWRNSEVCAAEVLVVLLGGWGGVAAGMRRDGGSPRRHRVGTPPATGEPCGEK